MKIIFFLILQVLISSITASQWIFEATLPNIGSDEPNILQVKVIDSSVSWAFGIYNINVNQNYFFPYFARRSGSE